MGADRNDINNINNNGLPTVADGPFAPGSVGYLKDPGFPKYNLDKAKALVQAYVKSGGKAQFTLSSANDPETLRLAALIQERAKQVGVTVKIKPAEQAALINDTIGGKFQRRRATRPRAARGARSSRSVRDPARPRCRPRSSGPRDRSSGTDPRLRGRG